MRMRSLLALLLALWVGQAYAGSMTLLGAGGASWVLPGATIDMDFANGRYFGAQPTDLTVTRASAGSTDLLPSSASGFAYSTFSANTLRLTPGLGVLVEESRKNFLLNSAAPATQTTASLATGTYTLWVNGAGTATMSAGTGAGCGTSAASQSTPISFTITVAGTCTVTVSGSLNAFQLELNPGSVSAPTSLIITTGATVTRAADSVHMTSPPVLGTSISMFAQGIPQEPTTFASGQGILSLSDGTTVNRATVIRPASTAFIGTLVTAGPSPSTTTAWAQTTSGKVAFAFQSGSGAVVFNAGSAFTASTAGFPTGLNSVQLGNNGGGAGAFFDGYISRFALWPSTLLSNATLQAITAP